MSRVWLTLAALCLAGTVLAAEPAGRGAVMPVVASARARTQCVEPADVMRRNHMNFLKHQRDDTVHGGVRGARHSLKACIDCHAGAGTRSVNQAADDFCVSCHRYAAVKIDCFECHTGKARVAAQGAAR